MARLEIFLAGSVALASALVGLFFLRFWVRTRDSLFIWFAVAFLIEAVSRCVLAFRSTPNENEPLFYLPRLLAFSLIAVAVFLKNRPHGR